MKVLFAVNDDQITKAIVKKYQQDNKEIIAYKSVYYFNAILKELQKDPTYDRIVISEDLEPFANNNFSIIDKFIFEKLDAISDEAANSTGDTPIILLCYDRRNKGDDILVKLFGIGIYDALLGQDRSIDQICGLLKKSRNKKEAKMYYNIDSDDVSYEHEAEDSVSDVEIQNILVHYKRLGKNEDRYVDSFNNIAAQYTDGQLRTITKFLPANVKNVLEVKSPKYQSIMSFKTSNDSSDNTDSTSDNTNTEQNKFKIGFIENEKNKPKLSKPVIVPNTVNRNNIKKIVTGNKKELNNNNKKQNNNYDQYDDEEDYDIDTADEVDMNEYYDDDENENKMNYNEKKVNKEGNQMSNRNIERPENRVNKKKIQNNTTSEMQQKNVNRNQNNNRNEMQNRKVRPQVNYDEDLDDEDYEEEKVERRGRPKKNENIRPVQNETPKKGRGRPKKEKTEEEILAEEAPKKGRGRPRKNNEEVEKVSQAPKKGRGRPKKNIEPFAKVQNKEEDNDDFDFDDFYENETKNKSNVNRNYSRNNSYKDSKDEYEDLDEYEDDDEYDDVEEEKTTKSNVQNNKQLKSNNQKPIKTPVQEDDDEYEDVDEYEDDDDYDDLDEYEDDDEYDDIEKEKSTKSNVQNNKSQKINNQKQAKAPVQEEEDLDEYDDDEYDDDDDDDDSYDIDDFYEEDEEEPVKQKTQNVKSQKTNNQKQAKAPVQEEEEDLDEYDDDEYEDDDDDSYDIDDFYEDDEEESVKQKTQNVKSQKINNQKQAKVPVQEEEEDLDEYEEDEYEDDDDFDEYEEEPVKQNIQNVKSQKSNISKQPVTVSVDDDEDDFEDYEDYDEENDYEYDDDDADEYEEDEAKIAESKKSNKFNKQPSKPQPIEEDDDFDDFDDYDDDDLIDVSDLDEDEEEVEEPVKPVVQPKVINKNVKQPNVQKVSQNNNKNNNNNNNINRNQNNNQKNNSNNMNYQQQNNNQKNNNKFNQTNEILKANKGERDIARDVNLSMLLTGNKKIVSFLGTSKNGTSFIVSNMAEMMANMGINVAVLDLTKNRNSYYVYTKNDERLRQKAADAINNLRNGVADGIKVNKNLTIYTTLPDEYVQLEDCGKILSTLLRNHSLILLDCDFTTPEQYFKQSQEIFLIQTMDVLTIQPLTAFLRDLKLKDMLEEEKIKIIINKEQRVRGLSTRAIIGGMAYYNDPSMSFMTELFDKDRVQHCVVPFDMQTYSKYLEGLVNCDISLKGYSRNIIESFKNIANMIYPVMNNKNNKKQVPALTSGSDYSRNNNNNNNNNKFSKSMNDTLEQMKKRY